jgi:hypothetical protein
VGEIVAGYTAIGHDGPVFKTVTVTPSVLVDITDSGRIIGVEYIGVTFAEAAMTLLRAMRLTPDDVRPDVRKVVEDTVENWRRRPRFDCEACEDSGVCTVCRGGSINEPGLSCLTCQNTHQCQRCNWFVLAEARAQIDQTGPLTEVPSGKDETP